VSEIRWCDYQRRRTPVPDVPSAFEAQVTRLGLHPDDIVNQMASAELKDWCEKNRLERFVPEILLNHWNMKVWEKDIVV